MEDYLKIKQIIKYILIIIVIIVIIVSGFLFYRNKQKESSEANFTDYLNAQEYTKTNDGVTYIKKLNDKQNTIYRALYGDYILFKEYSNESDNSYSTINIGYKTDGTVEITYRMEGLTKDNEVGMIYQTGTYKNNDFKCEIVNNHGFDTQCNLMKVEAQNFKKEIDEILKRYKINAKNITIEVPEYLQ